MTSPRILARRAQTKDEILTRARAQITQDGEVSLRSIARDMEMTPPALYRYFAGLHAIEDILVREVLVDALQAVDEHGWPGYVAWIAANPGRFAFLAKPAHHSHLAELHTAAREREVAA